MGQSARNTVIIVDDDEAVRDSMRALLESLDMNVRAYASAGDFLGSGSRAECGCLLLDLHMPRIRGLELLVLLRAEGFEMPVIVITGRSDPALKECVLSTGAQGFLDKPVDSRVLIQALETALNSPAASEISQPSNRNSTASGGKPCCPNRSL